MPQPEIAALLKQQFVALASDVDAPEAPLIDLVSEHMPDAMTLPFVIFTDASGAWLGGLSGGVHPDRFKSLLEDLVTAAG